MPLRILDGRLPGDCRHILRACSVVRPDRTRPITSSQCQ
jgi:hypothetical protein